MPFTDGILRKKAALDALRPLSGPSLAALDAWYDVELTYTSNALEGNTLTRSETAIVLEKGLTVSGKPLKDHLEAQGTETHCYTCGNLQKQRVHSRDGHPQPAPAGAAKDRF